MDDNEGECFDISFIKARAKNIVESNILCKQLKGIDRQCRRSVSRIESELREEKRFANRLIRDKKNYIITDKDRRDRAIEKMEKHRKSGLGKPLKYVWDDADATNREDHDHDEDMSVMGQGMKKEAPCQPKMYFWSQDSSTKLPVLTSFYGYRLSLQRSMTEVKLLGQQMYPEVVRETQSADPYFYRSSGVSDKRRVKTSTTADGLFDEDFCYEALKRAPPPSRENTNLSEVRTVSGLHTRNNSSLNAHDVRTRANTSTNDTKRNETITSETSAEELEEVKIKELDTDVKEKLSTNDKIQQSFPKVKNSRLEKTSPEYISLDLKQSDENLPQLSQRSVGATKGTLRPPTRRRYNKVNIKTRAEATKQYQAVTMKKTIEKPKVLTELEQTYSHIPSLMNEINKMQTTIEFMPKAKTGHYSKSAFGISMQSAISKKVLNNLALPAAFRKNNNTMLKHYGAPFMEVRATKMEPVPAK
jgi:hypothetical protein